MSNSAIKKNGPTEKKKAAEKRRIKEFEILELLEPISKWCAKIAFINEMLLTQQLTRTMNCQSRRQCLAFMIEVILDVKWNKQQMEKSHQ